MIELLEEEEEEWPLRSKVGWEEDEIREEM